MGITEATRPHHLGPTGTNADPAPSRGSAASALVTAMPTNDPVGQNNPTRANASNANERPDDPTRRCPACGTPVESARQVGPITYRLDPCGHQIDDRIHGGCETDASAR